MYQMKVPKNVEGLPAGPECPELVDEEADF
jgi:hypothetical protein